MDPEFWSKKVLTLIESRAESIIKGIYSKNVLNRLRGIVIGCDTLGNKGVKILMSIEMNNLKNILFANI